PEAGAICIPRLGDARPARARGTGVSVTAGAGLITAAGTGAIVVVVFGGVLGTENVAPALEQDSGGRLHCRIGRGRRIWVVDLATGRAADVVVGGAWMIDVIGPVAPISDGARSQRVRCPGGDPLVVEPPFRVRLETHHLDRGTGRARAVEA